MQKVLILGGSGMLGHTLFRILAEKPGLEVFVTARSTKELSSWLTPERLKQVVSNVDIHDFDRLVQVFADLKPDSVVNCVGVIKQAPTAHDPFLTISVNALFPHRLARLCGDIGARMIHISTDCVFDGQKGSYTESDIANATDLYGRTKYLGEVLYQHCITLRTSIIGHELKGRYGLVEWFLSQSGKVSGYTKAIYSGLPTVELSRIIADDVIPNSELTGLYHVSSPPISKYELLKLIAIQYGKTIAIEPEESLQMNRSLDSSHFRSQTGYNPPTWPELVGRMYEDYVRGPYQNEYCLTKGDVL